MNQNMNMNNMNNPNYDKSEFRKRLIISILGIAIVLVAIIGVSFAAYKNIILTDESNIQIGAVSVSFTESDNYINIEKGIPVSDNTGKTMNDNSFSFAVTTTAEKSATIPYTINVTTDDDNTLDDSYVKIYLLKENKEVVFPSFVSDLSVYPNRVNSKELYTTSDKLDGDAKEKITHYTLKLWIDKDFEVSSDSEKTYKLKVNVDSLLAES